MTKALWDSYLAAAKERYDEIEQAERFKLDLGNALARARAALLRDERDWPTLAKAAIAHKQNILINWRNHSKLTEWLDANVGGALDALSEMWSEDDRTPGDRIRAFDGRVFARRHGHSPQCCVVLHDGDRPPTVSAVPAETVPGVRHRRRAKAAGNGYPHPPTATAPVVGSTKAGARSRNVG